MPRESGPLVGVNGAAWRIGPSVVFAGHCGPRV